jgi:hypothetical protein
MLSNIAAIVFFKYPQRENIKDKYPLCIYKWTYFDSTITKISVHGKSNRKKDINIEVVIGKHPGG